MFRMSLIQHIEAHLGVIQGGWNKDVEGNDVSFQVVRCDGETIGRPETAFITLGLSNFPLKSRSGKMIRHELMYLTCGDYTGWEIHNIASVLQDLGRAALREQRPYLRGEVIRTGGLLSQSGMKDLCVSNPLIHDESFDVYELEDGVSIIIAWVFPVYPNEADYIQTRGWSAFQDLLIQNEPDVMNASRPPLLP